MKDLIFHTGLTFFKIIGTETGNQSIVLATGVRVNSNLCVKRERPLIITYSHYSKDIVRYHF